VPCLVDTPAINHDVVSLTSHGSQDALLARNPLVGTP
jgi:hypothetical protein